ncbi:MAG: class I SAM-dependent methyltransferase [Nitrospirota bacterium]
MFDTITLPQDILLETVSCDLCGSDDLEYWDTARTNTLSRCRSCGLVFTNPRIASVQKKDEVVYSKAYFQQKSRMTEKMINARKKTYQREIDALRKYVSGGRVLDVGCGMGVFLDAFGDEWEKYGCDVSSYALDIAGGKNIRIYHGEFEKLDFEQNFFDVVYFRASLHHTYSPGKCLEKAYRILKPGGVAAVCMSNNCGGPAGRVFRAHVKSYEQGHNYLFSRGTLEEYLKRSRFEIMEVSYPYFGSGYESYRDFIDFVLQYVRYLYLSVSSKLNTPETFNFSSPAFYGNYINIYARKEDGGKSL